MKLRVRLVRIHSGVQVLENLRRAQELRVNHLDYNLLYQCKAVYANRPNLIKLNLFLAHQKYYLP
jgi:hypothetical protein